MGKHKSKKSKRPRESSSSDSSEGEDRRDDHKRRTSKKPEEESETNLAHFSFLDHKSELNRIILGNSHRDQLVQEPSDLWLFVNKYEAMLKKSGNCVLPIVTESLDRAPDEFPTEFKTIHLNNIRFAVSVEEILKRMGHSNKLSRMVVLQFLQIVLQYLDFRQKEKFLKLKKLREAQANLPVAKFKNEIVEAVKREKVVLLAGDTGCGKSTQIPQYLHLAGFKGIGCTQPRRIACISLSKRVSHEMLCEYGTQVGYQIRFERSKTKDTNIIFLTEGLLLRQLSQEAMLSQFSCIVLDEIHERHLHGDFLLGVAKCLIKVRPDLKLILMSATINIKLFSDYFTEEEAHVIEVPGRLFPIKLHYMPQFKDVSASGSRSTKSERLSPEPYIQIMQLIDQKYPPTERGDMLIFMSGLNEITTIVDAANEYAAAKNNWIVLPLHSSMSIADQDKVFDYAPAGVRKCIVSTNIAETSVTIDGIRFVVDSGKVKEMSFDPSCKVSRLKEFSISKASADQRKGRAGRTGAGVCYRLYTEKDYNEFEAYSTPEIHRVPLENLLLQMVSMGLPNARLFPFIEPPPPGSIESSIVSLKQHGAMTVDEKLTPIGQALSRLPVDISISKMLLMGCVFSQLHPVLTLAATLSVQSPFTNRAYRDKECENARKDLESDHGDPITLLNSYREWLDLKRVGFDRRGEVENTHTWCRRRGLEEQRFYEITKLRNQFEELLTDSGLIPPKETAKMTSSERAIRHGELRQLKELKKAHKMEAPRKRNVLKHSSGFSGDGEEEEQKGTDMRDVEFRLSHDPSKMKNLMSSATACSYRDLMTLKLILVSGMYPQVAIADDFNYCKAPSQHFFHTTSKPFTSLHPMGFFGNNGQSLQLDDSEIVEKPFYYKSKLPLSAKHQLLCYQSLLETTKPYLMNTMRMPAAQTLLLFAHEIDTNGGCSKIICDSWLCLEFPHSESGMKLLQKATQLRHLWTTLLNQRLDALAERNGVDKELERPKRDVDSAAIERELWMHLANFMNTEVYYTLKRIMPADLKTLYVGYSEEDRAEEWTQSNPFGRDFNCQQNMIKGGWHVTENVTVNCVHETDWTIELENQFVEQGFTCSFCENIFHVTMLEKFQHVQGCEEQAEELRKNQRLLEANNSEGGESDSTCAVASLSSSSTAYNFECSICGGKFNFSTAVEKLRHRKQCQEERSSSSSRR